MSDASVVTRFAPSPTGPFHLGSARTALFNWMWARRTGGEFRLRIEDTDSARNSARSLGSILGNMAHLGLTWDGEIYYASQHAVEHVEAGRRLAAAGLAYYCQCTRATIDARGVAVGSGYDGFCRNLGLPEGNAVLRLANPGGVVHFEDAVSGPNTTNASLFGDFPLVKSDGSPLFLLGNVFDDAMMGVNWVIRGADHLPNNPRYVLLWEALRSAGCFELDLPSFGHLPLVLGPSGKKLSKRRDKVDVEEYLDEMGILPSALLTYLAGLGWGVPDGCDRYRVEELAGMFDLTGVGVSGSALNLDKLKAINADHLADLHAANRGDFRSEVVLHAGEGDALDGVLDTLPSRITTFGETKSLLAPILGDVDQDVKSAAKWLTRNPAALGLLQGFAAEALDRDWDLAGIEAAFAALSARSGLNMKRTTMPIRVAVLRSDRGLPLYEALSAMGRDVVMERIGDAIEVLELEHLEH